MKKTTKKASNKVKLKALEWTDEAIAECSAAGSSFFADDAQSKPEDITSMESKISRVQARKREAEERNQRRKKHPVKVDKTYSFAKLQGSGFQAAAQLADQLNAHFNRCISDQEIVIDQLCLGFHLQMYDSSVHDELLPFALNPDQPLYGACLLSKFEAQPESAVGKWYPCEVLTVHDSEVQVCVSGQLAEQTLFALRYQVCLVSHDTPAYAKRVYDALHRRNQAVALMRYHAYIRSMPVHPRVTSSMEPKQWERIYAKAASSKALLQLNPSVANEQIDEARAEFELVMNQILFDCNLLAKKNKLFGSALHLPEVVWGPKNKVAEVGLVKVPTHNLKGRLTFHRSSSYINSAAAINSLHCVLRENEVLNGCRVIRIKYNKPFSLEKFERHLNEQFISAVRLVKQDWPLKTGQAVRNTITKTQEGLSAGSCVMYDIGLRNIFEFENTNNGIRSLLDRMNFMMSDVLKDIVSSSLLAFTESIEDFCSCAVNVHDIRHIHVDIPAKSIYRKLALPPLFSVAFRIGADDKVLNPEEIENNKKDIAIWMRSKEAENGEKCPVAIIPPVVGKSFEYSQSPDEFKELIIKGFKHIVNDFLDVPHIQKFVLDRIYFPTTKFIPSVAIELDWVQSAADRLQTAINKALGPLHTYLKFFQKYESVVNIDINTYIAAKIPVTVKDPDSTEIELPVNINLAQVTGLINEHLESIKDVEESLPINPIPCGLFLVDVVSVRVLLLDKHRTIIRSILTQHGTRCSMISEYLEEEFKKISKKLQDRPENIEKLVEQEEYIAALPTTMNVLQGCIQDMMNQHALLEVYKHKVDLDSGTQRWNVFGAPAKIALKCAEVQENNLAIKRRFRDEMLGDQASYLKTLHELDHLVASLESLVDLSDVVSIAAKVKEVEGRIAAAQAKARQFNSRESLFEQDITDYEELNRISRSFEPYSNLWQTAKDWIELAQQWRRGRFVDLNADDVERNVDKFNIAINKAAKYFQKTDLKHQSAITNKIKMQIQEFLPEVPMIVTLRNPGMRDRHWEKIAQQLNVDILPIENFSTEQIIAMNLKDSLELIQKIGESAAKEYQIEQALDKMEKEWENMNLSIVHYRETGTGILKGVDDINVVLDEQITMTQVLCSSLLLLSL